MTNVLTMPFQSYCSLGDVHMVWSQKETRALNWNWTSHPNRRGFSVGGGVLGSVFFFSGEREREREREWESERESDAVLHSLGMYWLRIQLSAFQLDRAAALLTAWGLNQDSNTPDGWGRTHPGFTDKTSAFWPWPSTSGAGMFYFQRMLHFWCV